MQNSDRLNDDNDFEINVAMSFRKDTPGYTVYSYSKGDLKFYFCVSEQKFIEDLRREPGHAYKINIFSHFCTNALGAFPGYVVVTKEQKQQYFADLEKYFLAESTYAAYGVFSPPVYIEITKELSKDYY